MRKLYVILLVLLMGITHIHAFTWENCVAKYEKARQFSDHTRLSYTYLKFTKSCLIKFKKLLAQHPNPEFTVEAMRDNIQMINKSINQILPKYNHPKNSLEQIPRYIQSKPSKLSFNEEYHYFKKFDNCNGVHAQNRIYTAKHCHLKNAKNIHHDLSFLQSKTHSNLQTAPLKLNEKGVFKYYSMSKMGMFYNVLLKEENCHFYTANNELVGQNKTLDLGDLTKTKEIRSNCLSIPSNSGGGVFQEGKLVGIISKTVFSNNEFKYSVIEPIVPLDTTPTYQAQTAF